jgi:hypothetical protein
MTSGGKPKISQKHLRHATLPVPDLISSHPDLNAVRRGEKPASILPSY